MKNVTFLHVTCCLLLLPMLSYSALAVGAKKAKTNSDSMCSIKGDKLNKEYVKSPEHFIHINLNCYTCMIARSANAGCVVSENGKILLVRDSYSGKLGLPGGTKKKHEVATVTATRKTLEETGLVVYIDDFVSEFKNGFRLYKCKIIKDTKKKNNRIIEVKYVNKKELGKLLKKENRKDVRFPYELDLVYSSFGKIAK